MQASSWLLHSHGIKIPTYYSLLFARMLSVKWDFLEDSKWYFFSRFYFLNIGEKKRGLRES